MSFDSRIEIISQTGERGSLGQATSVSKLMGDHRKGTEVGLGQPPPSSYANMIAEVALGKLPL